MNELQLLFVFTIIYVLGISWVIFNLKNIFLGGLVSIILNIIFAFTIGIQSMPTYMINRYTFTLCLGFTLTMFCLIESYKSKKKWLVLSHLSTILKRIYLKNEW